MNEGDAPRVFYLVLMLVFVASALVGMRLPIAKVAKMILAWAAIFGLFFILFTFRGEFRTLGQRLKAEVTGEPVMVGRELRIEMAADGHFWVTGDVNDARVRFLVDSGASTTTISESAARSAGVEGTQRGFINTANGSAPVSLGRAGQLTVGTIERADFPVLINGNADVNVLGMNFLSSLAGWRVENGVLILQP